MKITLLGTGSILTNSLSACAVIDDEVLFDVPNGSIKAARRAGFSPGAMSGALISHFHADHFFDVVFLLLELGLRQVRTTEFVLAGPSGLEERVIQLLEIAYPESRERVLSNANVRFVEITNDEFSFTLGEYAVSAHKVQHSVPLAYGYVVTKDDRSVGFSGDSELCSGVEQICGNSRVAVLDSSFMSGRKGHMGYDDVSILATKYPECRIIATHMSDEVSGLTSEDVTVPTDGFTLDV